MTKKTLIALAAIVPLVAVASGAAYARWGGNPGKRLERAERFIKWRVNDALSELDATEEQSTAINSVVDDLLSDALPMIKQHRSMKREFRSMIMTEEPDRDAIRALIDERFSEFKQLAYKAADAALKVHGELTPEQLRELDEMLPRRPR
ncbi:MAG: periplasmic heavy metal sensor [Myxococcota bacterium]